MWAVDQWHEKLKMPNLCALCAHEAPARGYEVRGHHSEVDRLEIAPGIGKTLSKTVVHRIRVPLCQRCWGKLTFHRRLVRWVALAVGAVTFFCLLLHSTTDRAPTA